MARLVSKPWFITAVVIILAVLAAGITIGDSVPDPGVPATLSQRKPDPTRGAYIAVLGDCAFCHTAPGGQPYAGGLAFNTPLGVVYSGNISPDRDTGIGSYTLADFLRVMRLGVTPDGTRLYPAMPYTAFAKVSDEDLQDLFAYLQATPAPVHETSRKSSIAWPLSIRWPLAFWNLAFHDKARFVADASQDAAWNRGAYLVQGLAHCGTCHTPRGLFFQEKDVSGESPVFLSGTGFDGTSPINLRSNVGNGLGLWSASDIAILLKSGRNEHSAVTGPMADAVRHSTQFMTDEDTTAIAVYLKSLALAPGERLPQFAASDATLRTMMAGQEDSPGGRIFMDSCAACHRLSGSGESLTFPTLAGNATVLNSDPASLIGVILAGARVPSTEGAPTGLAMPGFGWRYDDVDIAALATFVRSSWGNQAPAVSASQVARIRKQLGLR